MVSRILGRFAELVNHDLGGTVHGIAHAKVNDVCALLALGQFQGVESPEEIGRQPGNALGRFYSGF